MSEQPEITLLMTAKSSFDAQVVAGVLRQAGIPVYIGGERMDDELAPSRVLANASEIEVHVPVERLDDARRAVREADESAKLLDDPSFDPGPPADGEPGSD